MAAIRRKTNGRTKKKSTDIGKISDMSINIADNIGTDILHQYLTRGPITDISAISTT
ncbi:hypothetical protein Hanom_Chr13g01224031 [Helianthus anomalus]